MIAGHVCDSVTSLMPVAVYTSCVGARSGDTCTPTCHAGDWPTVAATGITLACDVDGSFDGTDASLACGTASWTVTTGAAPLRTGSLP